MKHQQQKSTEKDIEFKPSKELETEINEGEKSSKLHQNVNLGKQGSSGKKFEQQGRKRK